MTPEIIQFADDTVIIAEPHPTTLRVLTLVLKLYEDLTRLKINRTKSSFVAIALPQDLNNSVRNLISCDQSKLPMKYLGLPLTIRKPSISLFQQLIDSVRKRLSGWKANVLSYGGRVTLIKSVLSVLPLHCMQVFKLPKGVIREIDKIRRNFL